MMNFDQEKMVEDVAAYSKLWMDFTSRMMSAGLNVNPKAPPQQMAEDFRKGVLGVVSEYSEAVMRSPQFLEMMKRSMDNVMAARQQLDQAMTSIRHDTQGTTREDIDSLMVTIRHMGTRIFDRLDALEIRLAASSGQTHAPAKAESSEALVQALERIGQRLDGFSERLDAIEAAAHKHASGAETPEDASRGKQRPAGKPGGAGHK